MRKIFSCRAFRIFLTSIFISLALASRSEAVLSPSGAFTLIRRIPPGEPLGDAAAFLGQHVSEKTVDSKEGIKIRRWGTASDKWFFEVLHDGSLVRAARINWVTASRGEQQKIFGQLTGEGRRFFGKGATYRTRTEAEWTDFGEKWLVLARQGEGPTDGVTLLSGIRDAEMDSGKYGF
ncbi:MAG: hypothetical protein LBF92_10540 [Synergistaceae bacterium]|jgi:hypothetical protein|nr:hypothetical protein [Synergistaceae bacterium]